MQLSLDFSPGLTAQFPEWEDVLNASVYGCRKGLNGVAGDLDMSPSELSKRLNRNADENRPLRVQDAVRIVESTGDLRPVYWLIERFLRDPTARKEQAINQLADLLPTMIALVEQSGVDMSAKKRK